MCNKCSNCKSWSWTTSWCLLNNIVVKKDPNKKIFANITIFHLLVCLYGIFVKVGSYLYVLVAVIVHKFYFFFYFFFFIIRFWKSAVCHFTYFKSLVAVYHCGIKMKLFLAHLFCDIYLKLWNHFMSIFSFLLF